jgi:hypothetical protein
MQMIVALFMDRGDSLLLEEYSYPVVTGGLGGRQRVLACTLHVVMPESLEVVCCTA